MNKEKLICYFSLKKFLGNPVKTRQLEVIVLELSS